MDVHYFSSQVVFKWQEQRWTAIGHRKGIVAGFFDKVVHLYFVLHVLHVHFCFN